jgi:hypothetical protein
LQQQLAQQQQQAPVTATTTAAVAEYASPYGSTNVVEETPYSSMPARSYDRFDLI